MRDDLSHGDPTAAPGTVASVGVGRGATTVVWPRIALRGRPLRVRVPSPALRVSRLAFALAALGALLVGCVALVVVATAGPNVLAPGSSYAFPGWVAGPLHGIFGRLISSPSALS
ncbi:MAG: hypothetical protein M3065_22690, partial [Actinomycetota bacterium]|nr:hypothetical protein [Actinomycetota bacterium]